MDNIKFYTLSEVQALLKVSQRTLYNYIKAEQLHALKLGREWRVSEKDLKDFLVRGTEINYLDKLK